MLQVTAILKLSAALFATALMSAGVGVDIGAAVSDRQARKLSASLLVAGWLVSVIFAAMHFLLRG